MWASLWSDLALLYRKELSLDVERVGGMLIHGAVIAREYGLPCVTGVQSATSLIETGDFLVVEGCLGIVTLEERGV